MTPPPATPLLQVLVVTPATLCDNWQKEVRRWLGSERLQARLCCALHCWHVLCLCACCARVRALCLLFILRVE